LGTALPATLIDQDEALRIARPLCCRTPEQETWLPAMYGHTGIERRHLVLGDAVVRDVLDGTRHTGSPFLPTGAPDDCGPTTRQRMEHYEAAAGPLALTASRAALAQGDRLARTVTHLVTVSCTGFYAPGVDVELVQGLPLPPAVQRTHVGYMGCHGALNGLRVANAFCRAEPGACVLLCATELCSLHYHYGWDPQKIIANALFADGSAAVLAVPGRAAPADAWRLAANGSCVFPDSRDAMTWTVGNYGFEMTLAKNVPRLIGANLRPWLTGWLAEHETALADVASWAIHPGGPRILDAVEDALGLSREATAAARAVFANHGNMSSPTVLFILDHLRRQGAPRPCVALGFGPGLTVEAALFR
jgi:prepilin-type processing-associated H-X9-DG protein